MIVKVIVSLVGVSIIFFCFWLLYCVRKDYFYQQKIIEGQKIRQQNSDVEYAKHIHVLKEKRWLRHKNFGIGPEALRDPIKVIDYSVECSGIVEKRGLL